MIPRGDASQCLPPPDPSKPLLKSGSLRIFVKFFNIYLRMAKNLAFALEFDRKKRPKKELALATILFTRLQDGDVMVYEQSDQRWWQPCPFKFGELIKKMPNQHQDIPD